MMRPEALGALIEAADDLGIRFISDEIYHGLVYDGVAETALRFSPRRDRRQFLLEVLLHDRLADRLDGAAGGRWSGRSSGSRRTSTSRRPTSRSARPSPPSRRPPELEAIKASYADNRRILLDRLPAIGFDEYLPVDGAFYVYASVRRFSNNSVDFTRRMLAEAGVAATPGPGFRPRPRPRTGCASPSPAPTPDMAEAMDRLGAWLG